MSEPSAADQERSDRILNELFRKNYSGRIAKDFRHQLRRELSPMIAAEFAAIRIAGAKAGLERAAQIAHGHGAGLVSYDICALARDLSWLEETK